MKYDIKRKIYVDCKNYTLPDELIDDMHDDLDELHKEFIKKWEKKIKEDHEEWVKNGRICI